MNPVDLLRTRRDELAAQLRTAVAQARTIADEIADIDAAIATLARRRDQPANPVTPDA